MNQDLVVGAGEVGTGIFQLLEKGVEKVVAYDQDSDKFQFTHAELRDREITVLHLCTPFNVKFHSSALRYVKTFPCKELVVHSTVRPGTCSKLQENLEIPVVYSPVRGVHVRMLFDLKRYTKYWATSKKDAVTIFPEEMHACGVKTKFWESTTQLELAKILMDTTYYGWLILFAQRVKILCDKYGVDEPSIWGFTHEIQEFLANRPTMYSGTGIRGHCVLQNLEILDDDFIDLVFTHDKIYRRHLRETDQ